MNLLYVWLAVTAIALMVEFLTTELVSLWFAGGGVVALVMSLFDLPWYFQVIAFLAVSFILLFICRRIIMRKINIEETLMNADTAIGKDFVLLTPIEFNQPGTIKVNDIVWNAIAENNKPLPSGIVVRIVELRGNKYVVTKVIEEEEEN